MTFQQVNVIPEIPGPQAKEASAAPSVPSVPKDTAAAPKPEDRPSWLPEKFASAEDLAKAYTELEKKNSGKLDKVEAPKAVDFEPYTKEFVETGNISEESMKKLESSGIPSNMIRQYIDGARALAEKQVNELTNEIGGREVYSSMVEWASKNLSPQEIEAYNKAVSTDDAQQQALAVRGLYSKFKDTAGPSFIKGKSSSASNSAPFESWAQVKEAMKDPRYGSDPAYRQKVTERLANSKTL